MGCKPILFLHSLLSQNGIMLLFHSSWILMFACVCAKWFVPERINISKWNNLNEWFTLECKSVRLAQVFIYSVIIVNFLSPCRLNYCQQKYLNSPFLKLRITNTFLVALRLQVSLCSVKNLLYASNLGFFCYALWHWRVLYSIVLK